jgi:GntR family transcriptional regulator
MEGRYAELAQVLVSEISGGNFPVGSNLPSEVELAKQYKVSRTTVRSALSVLEGLGLISRRRRVGTRVEAIRPPKTYTRSLSHIEDLTQYAAETERHVQSMREIICDEALSATLGCRPGQRWLLVEMLRLEPGREEAPICWTDVYLDPSVAKAVGAQVRQTTGLICDIIERATGRVVVDVQQTIRAVQLSAALAKKLNVETGSAALAITRRYVDQGGTAFQITVSTHPADRFSYYISLRHTLESPRS